MKNEKTIEDLFNEFISLADHIIKGDEERKEYLKGFYFAAVGHFLSNKAEFIFEETTPKKMIEHLSMMEEIRVLSNSVRSGQYPQYKTSKPQEPQEPQEPQQSHEKH